MAKTLETETAAGALELLQRVGGQARRVRGIAGMPPDSLLAVYRDRLTYTFIVDQEVASIHYDHTRREIFYRGHNIANMMLNSHQRKLLKGLVDVLAHDGRAQPFIPDYLATLDRIFADKG